MEKELIQAINNLGAKFDMLIEVLKGSYVPQTALPTQTVKQQSKYTFFEWLDIWFKEFKAVTLRDGGYDMQNTINKHIKPNIADKPLSDYNGVTIQEAVNKIQSKRMGQIVHSIFNQCFQSAVDFEYIKQNPVEKVNRPKHEIEQGRALTKDERRLFLYEAKKSELYSLFRFYLLTGCRKAEALTITWDDITETEIFIKGTKTKNAVRRLPIYPQLRHLLNSIEKNSKIIFPYSSDKVRYEFEKIRNRMLCKDITIHDLRHTFATVCLESGVSLKAVQKWLGHADYTTTANIYSHITTEFEHEEIGRLSQNIITLKSDKFIP